MFTILATKAVEANMPVGSVETMRASCLLAAVRGLRRDIGMLDKV
jgi:hypothetical protein